VPGKSRHGKKKFSHRKKGKSVLVSSPLAAQQRVDTQPSEVITSHKVATPSAGVPMPTSAQYPYIVTELRGIGILTGIILVILVVLFLVLS
jgi:hypothetical protein